MKIAISASKCCIRHFEALFILFILHIAGRMSPAFEFYLHIFIADGYPIDRLFDDEAVLRVRHCIFIIFCNF
mgnify:FL=1